MNYLYHHNNQWMCFEGELPIEPDVNTYHWPNSYRDDLIKYNQAIATLKSKALPVANPQICPQNMSQVKEGEIYEWPGTVEKKENKVLMDYDGSEVYPDTKYSYILRLPKPDMSDKEPIEEDYYLKYPPTKGPDEFVKGQPESFKDFIRSLPKKKFIDFRFWCLRNGKIQRRMQLRSYESGYLRVLWVEYCHSSEIEPYENLKKENARLRDLIEKAFKEGYGEGYSGGTLTWEQFKKDNDLTAHGEH